MSDAFKPAGTDRTAIVHEHGAVVWRPARRILGDEADALAGRELEKVHEMKGVRYKLEIRHRIPGGEGESTNTAIITFRSDGLRRTEEVNGPMVTIWHATIHSDVRDLFRPAAAERIDTIEAKQVGAVASIGYRHKTEQGMLHVQQAWVYVDPETDLHEMIPTSRVSTRPTTARRHARCSASTELTWISPQWTTRSSSG